VFEYAKQDLEKKIQVYGQKWNEKKKEEFFLQYFLTLSVYVEDMITPLEVVPVTKDSISFVSLLLLLIRLLIPNGFHIHIIT